MAKQRSMHHFICLSLLFTATRTVKTKRLKDAQKTVLVQNDDTGCVEQFDKTIIFATLFAGNEVCCGQCKYNSYNLL